MSEIDREKIIGRLSEQDDFTGVHDIDAVVHWASREAMVADTNVRKIMEAVGKRGHGRLIVMEHPADDSEWGPIGCVLPLNEDVSEVLIAFVTGHIYTVSDTDIEGDDDDDDDAHIGYRDPRNFVQMYYPNREPIRVSGTDIEAVETRLMQWGLPYDRESLAASTNPAQEESVREDIARALTIAKTVDFHARREESIQRAKDHLIQGLGELLDFDSGE